MGTISLVMAIITNYPQNPYKFSNEDKSAVYAQILQKYIGINYKELHHTNKK